VSFHSGRTRVLVAASLAMIITLSGCASEAVDSQPATSNSSGAPSEPAPEPAVPTASATPSAAPVSSPAPVDGNDPDSWVIDFSGVGPLKLGDPIAQAEESAPAYTREPNESCPPVVFLVAEGFPSITVPDPYASRVIEFIAVGDMDPQIVANTAPRTSAGIGIGATLEELRATYPDLSERQVIDRTHYFVTDGSGSWITFQLDEQGLVDSVTVSADPDLPSEYCG
jgi:hypothetical protein